MNSPHDPRPERDLRGGLVGLFIVGSFIAFMIATVGAALYPDLHKLSQPILCRSGHIEAQKLHYQHRRESGYEVEVACIGPDNEARELGLSTLPAMYAMLILPTMFGLWLLMRLWIFYLTQRHGPQYMERLREQLEESRAKTESATDSAEESKLTRALEDLEEARRRDLITQREYEEKRKQILQRY